MHHTSLILPLHLLLVLLTCVVVRVRPFRYRYRIPVYVTVTVSGTVRVLNGTRYLQYPISSSATGCRFRGVGIGFRYRNPIPSSVTGRRSHGYRISISVLGFPQALILPIIQLFTSRSVLGFQADPIATRTLASLFTTRGCWQRRAWALLGASSGGHGRRTQGQCS